MNTESLNSRIRRRVCLAVGVSFLSGAGLAVAADTTPPTITAAVTPAPNANGWNRTNVTVRFTCADTESGIAVCPAAIVVRTEGSQQVISGTARDKAGNSASASVTLNIDKTPPVVTATRSPMANSSGWSASPVTVTFAATDSLSGVAPGSLTAPAVLGDRRNGSAKGVATDLAGNVGTFTLTGINVDTRKPTITVALSPGAVGGYRTAPVTAHFTCADPLSGVAVCPPDQVFTSEGANQTVTGSAIDAAGNAATASKSFNIDATPPLLAITAPPSTAAPGSQLTIAGSAIDALSGVATLMANGQPVTIGATGGFSYGPLTLADGANVITFVATDRVGNAVQQAVSVTTTSTPPPPPPPGSTNLVQDPQFDAGESGFAGQDQSSSVVRTTVSPLEGGSSLHVGINGYGNNVWWSYDFTGGRASAFRVSAHLRSDAASSSDLQFCAMVYYASDSADLNCATVSGAPGDKGTISAALTLDPAKLLQSVNIRLIQQGGAPVSFTLDAAAAFLDVLELPPTGGGGGGGGGWRRRRRRRGGRVHAARRRERVSGLHLPVAHRSTVHLACRLHAGRRELDGRRAPSLRGGRPARGESAIPLLGQAHGPRVQAHRPAPVPHERHRARRSSS